MPRQRSMVQKRGQVTIPAELRRDFGIEAGDEVAFRRTEEGILITPVEEEKITRFRQLLAEMNAILEEAGRERGKPYTLDELIESGREIRGKLIEEKYGLTRDQWKQKSSE